jgi:hypothetical protein
MPDPVVETPTVETPLPNTAEARTPTGELKDNTQSLSTTSETDPKTTPEPKVEGKEGDKAPKTEGAPETYTDFTAPEGFTLNKEVIEKAAPIFKELGLTQDQAQKLVNLQTEREAASSKAGLDAYNATRAEWRKEVLGDAELSTGGKVKPEVLQNIGKAIDSVGDPALSKSFREVMDSTGVGDNPAFVKMMYKWSQAVTEGGHVAGKGPSAEGQKGPDAAPKTLASAMYPNLK